jgi:hypothetical protein
MKIIAVLLAAPLEKRGVVEEAAGRVVGKTGGDMRLTGDHFAGRFDHANSVVAGGGVFVPIPRKRGEVEKAAGETVGETKGNLDVTGEQIGGNINHVNMADVDGSADVPVPRN